jgi:hypothetical protein
MFWLADFLDQPPSQLVQTLHDQAQQPGTRDPIVLWLDVNGWPKPRFLSFVSDRILTGGSEIDLQEAIRAVLDFYLNLRMAAAFALRVRRFAKARGIPMSNAIEDWAFWEHGYPDFRSVPELELDMIKERIEELRSLYDAGRKVLQAQRGKARSAGGIRVPAPILDSPLRSPEAARIHWGEGEPLRERQAESLWVGMPRSQREDLSEGDQVVALRLDCVTTHLAAWLALPPEKIIQKIAQAAGEVSASGRVLLWLDVLEEPPGALIFEGESIIHAFISGGTLASGHAWEINRKKAAELIAEQKLHLRRAAVYAAWVEARAKRRGISVEDWIQMDALATYGFAEEMDVPEEASSAIKNWRSELLELYKIGLFVLEAGQPHSRRRRRR